MPLYKRLLILLTALLMMMGLAGCIHTQDEDSSGRSLGNGKRSVSVRI